MKVKMVGILILLSLFLFLIPQNARAQTSGGLAIIFYSLNFIFYFLIGFGISIIYSVLGLWFGKYKKYLLCIVFEIMLLIAIIIAIANVFFLVPDLVVMIIGFLLGERRYKNYVKKHRRTKSNIAGK